MKCIAFPNIRPVSEDAPDLVDGDTICLLLLGCYPYCTGFDMMNGMLLGKIPARERNISSTQYREIGTWQIKLKNCDEYEGESRGAAVDGLVWYMANHLKRQSCISSVVVVQ